MLKGIIAVHLALKYFARRQMLLIIMPRHFALTVISNRRVADLPLHINGSIDKQHRIAALGRLGSLVQQPIRIALYCRQELLPRMRQARHIAGFGQNNQIHALIALIHHVNIRLKALITERIIRRIIRLNHTSFHHAHPFHYMVVSPTPALYPIPTKQASMKPQQSLAGVHPLFQRYFTF